MILWCIMLGALLGWGFGGFGGDGIWPGAVLGAAMGWWLRRVIRKEITGAQARFRDEYISAAGGLRAFEASRPEPGISAVTTAEALRDSAPAIRPVTTAEGTQHTEVPTDTTPPTAVTLGQREEVPDNGSPAPPKQLQSPTKPGFIDRGIAAAVSWLVGGNTIVRVGLVILFVGLSFLASYAANAGLFPIELRLALVAAAGVALLAIGFGKRRAKPEFALSLQGGGVAILYLTLFAASRLFEVIPAGAAFPLMILVCALGCALALIQDSQAMAATSFAGGFAVPLLLAGGGGPLGMFLYYTALNLAIPVIAWARGWRIIGLMGFFATFGIATLWGVLVYDPALYGLSQFFLILFVLIYVVAGILNAANRPGRFGNAVDGTLLFGPALVGFGLQVGLVRGLPLGSAFSAIGFGALYLALAFFVMRRGRGDNIVLRDGLIAVAVGFVTLAVPLALGVRWTACVWALEGAGAFWVGMRQARWVPRMFGLALQGAAALAFLIGVRDTVSAMPLLGPNTLGALLLALPALVIAWWLRHPIGHSDTRLARGYADFERALPQAMFLYGFFLWCVMGLLEINRLIPSRVAGEAAIFAFHPNVRVLLAMLAFVGSAGIAAFAGRRLTWAVALWPARVTLLALVAGLFALKELGGFVLVTPNWLFWSAALAIHYRLLWEDDSDGAEATRPLRRMAHVGSVWLLAAMLADCLWLGVERGSLWHSSWAGVAFLVAATASLLVLTLGAGRSNRAGTMARWPLRGHAEDYYWFAALPIAACVYAGAAGAALFASGETAPLPYVPLLNPVDLSVGLALATLALWQRTITAAMPLPPGAAALKGLAPLIALASLGFVAISTVWLRMAHHLLGLGWSGPALLGSFVVQMGLSILWTLLALGLTLMAHRRGWRMMWLAGAGLLGLVVAKLLLVDLSNADGAARIVTFIVVGVLMLVVGYFAPLPPKAPGAEVPPVVLPAGEPA